MAYDAELAERVRDGLAGHRGIREKHMFGGVAFLTAGNMAVGVNGDSLIVRLSPDDAESALDEPGTRPFDMTGRPMKGWILVGPDGLRGEEELRSWLHRGLDYAGSLPAR